MVIWSRRQLLENFLALYVRCLESLLLPFQYQLSSQISVGFIRKINEVISEEHKRFGFQTV